MAYVSRQRRTPRRYSRYRKRTTRSGRRSRSTVKTRRYTRKRMSKRRILNTSSTKKRNGMLTWSNTTPTGAFQPAALGVAYVAGNTTGRFLWQATAMDLNDASGNPNLKINQAQRTATTCYMKGLSEHVRIQTSTGVPWFHRRICFTFRGLAPFRANVSGETTAVKVETTNGWQRLFNNIGVDSAPQTLSAREAVLFRGEGQRDWNDPILAPTDPTRIDVKFDKTWTLKSGNASGTVYERKLWHPMNQNLVYDDDEQGNTESTVDYSVTSKQGMGDYYVYDILSPGLQATAADIAAIYSNSTLYWHEK